MKKFVRITSFLLAVVLVLSFSACSEKEKPSENTDVTGSTSSVEKTDDTASAVSEEERTTKKNSVSIGYSDYHENYTRDGVLEYKNSRYYVSENKVYIESSGKKTVLSDQKCAESLSIFGDEIYYSVINFEEPFKIENDDYDYVWLHCSCWKMKADGSEKKKLFDYAGSGVVIFVDSDNIYYVDELERGGYYYFIKGQKGFYKYNKETGKSTELISEGGLKFSDPVYVGGCFLYSTSQAGYCRYDISTGKTREFDKTDEANLGLPQDTVKYDETTAYLSVETLDMNALYKYDAEKDTLTYFCDLDPVCNYIAGKGDGYLFFRTRDDGYKKFDINSHSLSDTDYTE